VLRRYSGEQVGGTGLLVETHFCELEQAGIASFVQEPSAAVAFINSSCLRFHYIVLLCLVLSGFHIFHGMCISVADPRFYKVSFCRYYLKVHKNEIFLALILNLVGTLSLLVMLKY
jgi:hypothetical protein